MLSSAALGTWLAAKPEAGDESLSHEGPAQGFLKCGLKDSPYDSEASALYLILTVWFLA